MITQKAQPEQSMHRTNITTTIVGESTHIVNRIKSLTVPCGSRLMLIFFSSGCCFSCRLLGAGTACSETVGFPTGCSYFDRLGRTGLRNVKLFGVPAAVYRPSRSTWIAKREAVRLPSWLPAVSWTVNTI